VTRPTVSDGPTEDSRGDDLQARQSDPEGSAQVQRWIRYSSAWTEHLQEGVSAAVAATLIVLAATILVASIVDFVTSVERHGLTLTFAATDFLDKVLLVLILVEIVHTVVLSLRAHALSAQPFIVVGLVAVIRKILFTLSAGQSVSSTTLGLYIGMVAVFVAGLVSIEVFGGRRRHGSDRADPTVGLH
jgi:uncharacterized membrane protein (DUF373 family)